MLFRSEARAEGQVLRKLNAAGVQCVPTLVCEGDVCDQVTISADWWERTCARASALPPPRTCSSPVSSSATLTCHAPLSSKKRKREAEPDEHTPESQRRKAPPCAPAPSKCPLRQHRHNRMVVEEICMPLENFQYGRQLVAVVADCVLGASRSRSCSFVSSDGYVCSALSRSHKSGYAYPPL